MRRAVLLGLTAFLGLLAPAAAHAQEDDEDLKRPGLEASYFGPQGQKVFVREEAAPAFLLAAGQSPDPRLPASSWKVKWSGVLEILKPGKYRLAAETSGKVSVKVAGREALALEAAAGPAREGAEVELKFGLHPLEVEFTPAGEGTRLKLYWSSEAIAREPLPPFALGRPPGSPEIRDPFAEARLAAEEHSCTACHKPSAGAPISLSLITRPGPRLSTAGTRLKAGWIYHWLANPQGYRAEAVMPRLFPATPEGDFERYAVAMFLASLGKPAESVAAEPALAKEGQALFLATGCAVCHEKQGARPPRATLSKLAAKTNATALASFLADTAAVDPAGRMPGFELNPAQTRALAQYLITRDPAGAAENFDLPRAPTGDEIRKAYFGREPTAAEVVAFSNLTAEKQLAAIGKRVFENRQCANCHELKLPGETAAVAAKPAALDFAAVAKNLAQPPAGKVPPACLAPADAKADGKTPVFGATFDRAGVAEFFKVATQAPGTPAPGDLARLSLTRFHCTGCHERNSKGGLNRDLIAKLLENQTEANAEAVVPPPLTGVTEKLLGTYLQQVLVDGRRARPWMGLKMPKFGKDHVGSLPAGLAALDGTALADKPFLPTPDPALAAAGRTLVGSQGFGCTKCHDMLGVASLGTRGPELSLTAERVNFAWYERWMTDPQRLQPGTRMPTVFLSGESPYKTVLKGDPQQQRLAVWHYLLAAKSMPAPEGLEIPKVVEVAKTTGGVQLLRTFLGGTTPRGIAIRSPNGVHLAYDAQSCHLAYAWTGEFLDMGPVWNGRGGNKAGLKGPTLWSAPAGFPWEVSSSNAVPDFSGRGKDYALGAELPHDGKLYPTRLHFKGYSTYANSPPTFRYELDLEGSRVASFAEGVSSLKGDLASGTLREIKVTAPAGQHVWLCAAMADQPPEWTTAAGASGKLDSDTAQAAGDAVVRVSQGAKATLFHLRGAPASAVWLAAKQQGKWALVLRMPADEAGAKINLATWTPTEAGSLDKVVAEELKAK